MRQTSPQKRELVLCALAEEDPIPVLPGRRQSNGAHAGKEVQHSGFTG